MERSKVNAYEIKITLKDSRPPIWRRVQVPATLTLYELHKVIQAVMGWQDYHLHYFLIDGQYYGDPEDDEYGDMGTIDENDFKLRQVIRRAGQKFTYEYDFGDSWQHELKVEKALELEKRLRAPVCVDGKRACPPEDVGGVHGYALFLEALRDPEHEEHESYLTWVGGQFDPDAFDLKAANERIKHMNDENILDGRVGSTSDQSLERWLAGLTEEQSAWAENLAMRRDMVVMLQYIQTNKVTGTSARGNFPLKAVREITAQFVHPPMLEETISPSYTYRIRSEEDVWPLYLLHMLGVVSGLLEGGPVEALAPDRGRAAFPERAAAGAGLGAVYHLVGAGELDGADAARRAGQLYSGGLQEPVPAGPAGVGPG
jgi:hypothetical protein